MKTALGIIFSNIHDRNVPELTQERTMASVPFGGKYRLIDFALSNLVNAGVGKVGVITKTNYQSLMAHVGSGKDWELARKEGGLIVLPPYSEAGNNGLYQNRLEALKGILTFINDSEEKYVILSDSDNACNIPLSEVLYEHRHSGADVTALYREMKLFGNNKKNETIFTIDDEGRITDMGVFVGLTGVHNVSLNIWIMQKTMLESIVADAIAHGYKSFVRDMLAPRLDKLKIRTYRYDGYYARIDSLQSYLTEHLRLLNKNNQDALFNVDDRPIYTKIKDSPPTHYGKNAKVSNSIIADGCYIDGKVKNCILSRGVRIGKNAVINNSVLSNNTIVGENCILNYVISDRSVVIKDGRILSGHETLPFFISKGKMI